MKVIIENHYDLMAQVASKLIAEEIRKNPSIVLGLATGSTPLGTYKELIRMCKEEGLDFSKVTTFNLDEYIGVGEDNPCGYRYFMDNELFNHINIVKENTHVPNGLAEDLDIFCKKYDEDIEAAGGIDIQILGIGPNGHIAFNEPDNALSKGTCVVKLTPDTIYANSRFFKSLDEVPKNAITMGVGSILRAKKIILLANGLNKAPAIKNILKDDKITTYIPATFLMLHPDVTIIVDEEAYSLVR